MSSQNFELKPYSGAKPVDFGMDPEAVKTALGKKPERVENYDDSKTIKNEYYAGGVRVHYDRDAAVDEISFVPRDNLPLLFEGIDLFDSQQTKNPLTILLREDDKPLDDYGFIVFEKLGIAVTGYHDNDKSQRAITIFRKGRWTDLDQAKPIDLSKFS